jgi:hypothetical protein
MSGDALSFFLTHSQQLGLGELAPNVRFRERRWRRHVPQMLNPTGIAGGPRRYRERVVKRPLRVGHEMSRYILILAEILALVF